VTDRWLWVRFLARIRLPIRLLVGGALLGTACADGSSPAAEAESGQPMLASLGAESFQQYCASCHGADGRGNGPAAAALRARPADLTRIAARRGGIFPEAEVATYIDGRFELTAHGTREMPVWGEKLGETIAPDVHPDEVVRGRIVTLVEYLKTIQRP
jgi:mono/diheme cytochrome c family protein